jgi:hypothetical protein
MYFNEAEPTEHVADIEATTPLDDKVLKPLYKEEHEQQSDEQAKVDVSEELLEQQQRQDVEDKNSIALKENKAQPTPVNIEIRAEIVPEQVIHEIEEKFNDTSVNELKQRLGQQNLDEGVLKSILEMHGGDIELAVSYINSLDTTETNQGSETKTVESKKEIISEQEIALGEVENPKDTRINELKQRLGQQDLDEEVLKSVLDMHGGDIDTTVTFLQNSLTQDAIQQSDSESSASDSSDDIEYSKTRSFKKMLRNHKKKLAQVSKTNYVLPTTWDKNPELRAPPDIELSSTFNDLDEDAIYTILSFCALKQYLTLGGTGKRYQEITSQNRYWRHLVTEIKLDKIKQMAHVETNNLSNMITFDGFRNDIKEAPPSMVLRAYNAAENGNVSSTSPDELNYKQHLAVFNRIKGLEQRRQFLVNDKTQKFRTYRSRIGDIMIKVWGGFLVLLLIGIIISSVLTPAYIDYFNKPYFWLIPYIPVFILLPIYVLFLAIEIKYKRFYPLWTRNQLASKAIYNYSREETINFDWTIWTCALFIWPVWLLVAVFIKMMAFPDTGVWTYFLIPTYVIMFGSYFLNVPSGWTMAKQEHWRAEFIVSAIGTFLLYVFLSLGIALIAAKSDVFPSMANIPYSATFIPFYICLLILQIFVGVVFFMALTRGDGRCKCKNICYFFGWECLATLITAPIFTSFLLVGLRLDSVAPSLPFIAALAPFYGAFVIYLIVGGAIAIGVICCCFLSGDSD